jgi:hypothetical protein
MEAFLQNLLYDPFERKTLVMASAEGWLSLVIWQLPFY